MMTPENHDGMDEGLYGEEEKGEPKTTDEATESSTGLISKSLLGGKHFGVGDEVVLEIVADHGEEVEVKYASEKPESKTESETKSDGGDELSSMNEKY